MQSIWRKETELAEYEPLCGEAMTHTVIIGGGMAGLLIAYELSRRGVAVAVLERNRIASGVTGNTTAKVTVQHNLIYHRLIRDFGPVQAAQYAQANRKALARYAAIIGREGINCGFERLPSYVYTRDETDLLYEEIKAAVSLGIDAEFTSETMLPFPVKGAVRFPNQAQMNPLAFLRGIVGDLRIYERTEVLEILPCSEEEYIVTTPDGKITARNVVIASHYPFINSPGYFFTRMHQKRSYVIALKNAPHLDGMYIDADDAGYSFRNHGEYLLFGGAGHRTGQNENGGAYEQLQTEAAIYYPGAEVVAKWSAQDCMTVDSVPYIGRYSEKTPHMYVATGFNKWGMTSSMAAALILADRITGEECPFAEVFTPQRFNTAGVGEMIKDGIKAATNLLVKPLTPPKEKIDELPNGHGGIVEYDGHKAGVYKDEQGECYIVSPKCPHLGCQLAWNPDEKTWDCPCHGSRFRYDGTLLDSPAQENLERF